MSRAIAWLRSEYGDELVERTLSRLEPEERRQLVATDLLLRWIDVNLFEKTLNAAYQEVFLYSGESREEFDRKGIEGGGSRILKEFFLLLFSMVTPTQILYRSISIRKRIYSNGKYTVLKNEYGTFSAEITVPPDMKAMINRELIYGYTSLLELASI